MGDQYSSALRSCRKADSRNVVAILVSLLPTYRKVCLAGLAAASLYSISSAVTAACEGFAALSLLTFLQSLPVYIQAALLANVALAIYVLYTLVPGIEDKLLLLEHHCFQVPDHLKMTRKHMIDLARKRGCLEESSLQFMESVLERNGLGDATGLPEVCHNMDDPTRFITLKDSMEETEMIIFDVVEKLLKKTGIHPSEIGMVITACSCFAPTPSMSSMLVNRFKLNRSTLTYSLAGMGCSASLICVDTAKHLLKSLPNTLCLVVNHENCCANIYSGNDRSLMMCNTLFRLGGAAIFLSNRPCDVGRAKYELCASMRMHFGADDDAFRCMGNAEDAEGKPGIFLSKTLISVASKGLHEALTKFAPHVLPITELAKCAWDRSYKPDFRKSAQHFLFHIGGRGVLDRMQEMMKLTDKNMQPAFSTLQRFGNMSSASTWYIMAYVESQQGVRQGDRLWQLGIGGGFKANSAIWRARRNILQRHDCWA